MEFFLFGVFIFTVGYAIGMLQASNIWVEEKQKMTAETVLWIFAFFLGVTMISVTIIGRFMDDR